MKYAEQLKPGFTGFVVHHSEILPVTVSDVKDISKHGSDYYIFVTKEVPYSSFRILFETLDEAETELLKVLLGGIQNIQREIQRLQIKEQEIQAKLDLYKLKDSPCKSQII